MRCIVLLASFVLTCLLLPSSANAQSYGERAYSAAFGPCHGQTCVVRHSPGGEINTFLSAARAVRSGAKRLVVIDGPCYSACAIFADVARERVCITNRASFGFHKGRVIQAHLARGGGRQFREVRRFDPEHSRDIAAWVYRNGGYPAQGLRMMNAREASRFWRFCPMRRS